MKIEELDNNFKNEKIEFESNKAFYNIPNGKFALYGIYYDESENRFRRFPQAVERSVRGTVKGEPSWLN